MVQDECVYTDAIDAFTGEFGIDHVFSVAPPSEWAKIYPRATAWGVRFSQNLTGYLSAETVERVDRIVAECPGTADRHRLPSLGRAALVRPPGAAAAPARGRVRAGGRRARAAHGPFHRPRRHHPRRRLVPFLASCRYVIGAEGAPILDGDGTFKRRTERYLAEHPDASFEQVEAACFQGRGRPLAAVRDLAAAPGSVRDPNLPGPGRGRLLRRAAPGRALHPDQQGPLQPRRRARAAQSDEQRERLTEVAYRDVVASGRYGHERFVAEVEQAATEGLALKGAGAGPAAAASNGARSGVAQRTFTAAPNALTGPPGGGGGGGPLGPRPALGARHGARRATWAAAPLPPTLGDDRTRGPGASRDRRSATPPSGTSFAAPSSRAAPGSATPRRRPWPVSMRPTSTSIRTWRATLRRGPAAAGGCWR